MANLIGSAPHIGEKLVKRILNSDLNRADAGGVLRGLMDAEDKHEPAEEFWGQMRKLVQVGNAAGLSTFKGAIGLIGKVLGMFGGVEAGRLKIYENTVVKTALFQVALHCEESLRARDCGRIIGKDISDIRPEMAQKVATYKTMMTDMADLMEDMRKGGGQMPSKKSGKEKQAEVEEEAPSNTARAFLKEHKGKTKEENTLLDCPFAAMKFGCSRGGTC